jgi:hypothetical protein
LLPSSYYYGIWHARDKLFFEDANMDDRRITEQAYSSIKEFQTANLKSNHMNCNNNSGTNRSRRHPQTTHHRSSQQNSKWRKPRDGRIKANSDANLSISGSWGLGGIFRDEEGQILATTTWKISGFNDPSTVEACALYFTMRLAIE